VVTTNHGPFGDELADIYRSVAGRVPIIGISRHQASTAGDIPIARVIHHGVDVEEFPIGAGDGGYLAFIGRMNAGKGVREAIDVAAAAGVPLKIAAKMREQAERDYFHAQVEPRLGRDVEYVGEITRDERNRLVGAAAALLNPIRWPEPFGLVMIEALACGTPVLALRAGAAPEIVDDGITGFVRDRPEDLTETVGAVDRLDRSACRAVAEDRFSTHRMVAEHLEFFTELLDRPPARSAA
jgi:glycosyltransferase involved in cell wall biosynthesis